MNIRSFILFVFIVFSCDTAIEKPNILIIYADDLGYGDVSSYESGTLQTPNIDKIANNGIDLPMDMQAQQLVVQVDMLY